MASLRIQTLTAKTATWQPWQPINEMLVQSWSGRIRVFPACPAHWRNCRIDRLLCEGGVEVSAIRSDGRTLAVRLESASDQQVRLLNPFDLLAAILMGSEFNQMQMAIW